MGIDILEHFRMLDLFLSWTLSLDTGYGLNVHKRSRRRPERLLNVLRTFNLRTVSRGVATDALL